MPTLFNPLFPNEQEEVARPQVFEPQQIAPAPIPEEPVPVEQPQQQFFDPQYEPYQGRLPEEEQPISAPYFDPEYDPNYVRRQDGFWGGSARGEIQAEGANLLTKSMFVSDPNERAQMRQEGLRKYQEAQMQYPKSINKIEDAETFGQGFDYLLTSAAESMPLMAETAKWALGGAAAGAVVGQPWLGAGTGALAHTSQQNASEVIQDLVSRGYDVDSPEARAIIAGSGLAAGALDVLSLGGGGKLVAQPFKQGIKKGAMQLGKNVLTQGAKGAVLEGATEATQEAINIGASRLVRGDATPINDDELSQAFNAFLIGGFAGGGTVGAGTGAVTTWKQIMDTNPRDRVKQHLSDMLRKEYGDQHLETVANSMGFGSWQEAMNSDLFDALISDGVEPDRAAQMVKNERRQEMLDDFRSFVGIDEEGLADLRARGFSEDQIVEATRNRAASYIEGWRQQLIDDRGRNLDDEARAEITEFLDQIESGEISFIEGVEQDTSSIEAEMADPNKGLTEMELGDRVFTLNSQGRPWQTAELTKLLNPNMTDETIANSGVNKAIAQRGGNMQSLSYMDALREEMTQRGIAPKSDEARQFLQEKARELLFDKDGNQKPKFVQLAKNLVEKHGQIKGMERFLSFFEVAEDSGLSAGVANEGEITFTDEEVHGVGTTNKERSRSAIIRSPGFSKYSGKPVLRLGEIAVTLNGKQKTISIPNLIAYTLRRHSKELTETSITGRMAEALRVGLSSLYGIRGMEGLEIPNLTEDVGKANYGVMAIRSGKRKYSLAELLAPPEKRNEVRLEAAVRELQNAKDNIETVLPKEIQDIMNKMSSGQLNGEVAGRELSYRNNLISQLTQRMPEFEEAVKAAEKALKNQEADEKYNPKQASSNDLLNPNLTEDERAKLEAELDRMIAADPRWEFDQFTGAEDLQVDYVAKRPIFRSADMGGYDVITDEAFESGNLNNEDLTPEQSYKAQLMEWTRDTMNKAKALSEAFYDAQRDQKYGQGYSALVKDLTFLEGVLERATAQLAEFDAKILRGPEMQAYRKAELEAAYIGAQVRSMQAQKEEMERFRAQTGRAITTRDPRAAREMFEAKKAELWSNIVADMASAREAIGQYESNEQQAGMSVSSQRVADDMLVDKVLKSLSSYMGQVRKVEKSDLKGKAVVLRRIRNRVEKAIEELPINKRLEAKYEGGTQVYHKKVVMPELQKLAASLDSAIIAIEAVVASESTATKSNTPLAIYETYRLFGYANYLYEKTFGYKFEQGNQKITPQLVDKVLQAVYSAQSESLRTSVEVESIDRGIEGSSFQVVERDENGKPSVWVNRETGEAFTKEDMQASGFIEQYTAAQAELKARKMADLAKVEDFVAQREAATAREEQEATYAKKAESHVKPTDDLLTMISKLGGINFDEMVSQGLDPNDMASVRWRIFRGFNNGVNARSLDGMRERLSEEGFENLNSENDLLNAINAAIAGEPVYTPQGFEAYGQRLAEEREMDLQAQAEAEAAADAYQYESESMDVEINDMRTMDTEAKPFNEQTVEEGANWEAQTLFQELLEEFAVQINKFTLPDEVTLLAPDEAVKLLESLGKTDDANQVRQGLANGKAIVYKDENGKNKYGIYVDPRLTKKMRSRALAHEIGHVVLDQYLDHISGDQAQAIYDEYSQYVKDTTYNDAEGQLRFKNLQKLLAARPEVLAEFAKNGFSMDTNVQTNDMTAQEYLEYVVDFKEWFADRVMERMLDPTPPKSTFQRFIDGLVDRLMKIWDKNYIREGSVADFVEDVMGHRTHIWKDAKSASEVLRSWHEQNMRDYNPETDPFNPEDMSAIADYYYSIVGVEADENTIAQLAKYQQMDRTNAIFFIVMKDALTRGMLPRQAQTILERMAQNSDVRVALMQLAPNQQVRDLLRKDDNAVIAYAYQKWITGELKLKAPAARSTFGRIKQWLKQTFDYINENEQADLMFAYIHSGSARLGKRMPSLGGQRNTVARDIFNGNIVPAWEWLQKSPVGALISTASTRLEATRIPALIKLGDLMYGRIGKAYTRLSYLHAREEMADRFARQANEIFMEFSNDEIIRTWEVLNAGMTELQMIENGIPVKIMEGAKDMRDFFARVHKYAQDGGLDMGYIENYSPWIISEKELLERGDEFAALFDEPEFRNHTGEPGSYMLDTILQSLDGRSQFNPANDKGVQPSVRFMNARSLKWIDEVATPEQRAKFGTFLSTDVGEILHKYINPVVKRVEFERRFGGDKFLNLIEQAEAQGATEKDIQLAFQYLEAVMGVTGRQTNEGLRKIFGADPAPQGQVIHPYFQKTEAAIMTVVNMAVLGLATLTSVPDIMGPMIRSSEVQRPLQNLREAFNSMKAERKGTIDDLMRLADIVGTSSRDATQEVLEGLYGGEFMQGTTKKINEKFFHYIGLNMWTRFTRIAATRTGYDFIAKHAQEQTPDSRRWLAELDLTPEEVQFDENGQMIVNAQVRNGIFRFVEQSVLRPNAALRPIWASDPHFALIFHLKSFMYTFHEVIVKRLGMEAVRGNIAPMAVGLMMVPLMMVSDSLRELIQYGNETPSWKQDWGFTDYAFHAAQRAGLPGLGQIGIDAYNDIKYGGYGFESFAGPTYDLVTGGRIQEFVPLYSVYKNWGD